MKLKKLNKKLVLDKKTIAHLNDNYLKDLRGGLKAESYWLTDCCPESNPVSACCSTPTANSTCC